MWFCVIYIYSLFIIRLDIIVYIIIIVVTYITIELEKKEMASTLSPSSPLNFGPGCFTKASVRPFFTDLELKKVDHFVQHYECAKNSLGYSKRVLGGILFRGIYIGKSSPELEKEFSTCVSVLEKRVREEFGTEDLVMYSLEFTNQAFKQKSRWHTDLEDSFPYLNVFIPLDDINEKNGMTTLKIDGEIIELKTTRNHWYSFDGSITHCMYLFRFL